MATHEEIRDMIQQVQVEASAETINAILDILLALNDRINEGEYGLD